MRRGFTLIELLIVIAIIIFLAKLVVPRYSTFYGKIRQTEVMLNLSNLYAAEQAYHLQHGRYTANLPALEWQPRGYTGNPDTAGHAYTYGSLDGGGQEGVSVYTGSSKTPAALLAGSTVTASTFILKAALKNEKSYEIWRVDESGEITKEV